MGSLSSSYFPKGTKFHRIFNGACIFVLFFFLLYKTDNFQNPIPEKQFSNISYRNVSLLENPIIRRKICENKNLTAVGNSQSCSGINVRKIYDSSCEYLRANSECNSDGYINYISFFYCDLEKFKPLGYVVLVIWLITLFYLLGNTVSDYFCLCLEKLSDLLNLPPTVAGVTLLPLGNGAPDVFSSIAAFAGRDSGDVGLNSVLGGAVFVTCIVVGAVSLCIADKNVCIDKKCFVRDILFFLFALFCLLIILVVGEVSIGGSIAFVSIYVLYAVFVATNEILRKYRRRFKFGSAMPLLPVNEPIHTPLLNQSEFVDVVPHIQANLPHWMWASHMAIYSQEANREEIPKHLWGWNEEETTNNPESFFSTFWFLLELPLSLPRRLTIPIIEKKRWSKIYAVSSASLAPMLLAFLIGDSIGYLVGGLIGGLLGILAFIYTQTDEPPRKLLLPWVLGGFLMSIIWFYIIANELVALLVAFGVILGIMPSLLALTILAWGNSMGDLISNIAIAVNGGDGVQVAMSGCYAGPMFNILAGLGISLLLGSSSEKSGSYVIPQDWSLYFTLGVLLLSLLWSLVVLPLNGMRPGKVLGVGLIVIYAGFLAVRVGINMGNVSE